MRIWNKRMKRESKSVRAVRKILSKRPTEELQELMEMRFNFTSDAARNLVNHWYLQKRLVGEVLANRLGLKVNRPSRTPKGSVWKIKRVVAF
jgi:hypothetical protein